MSRRWRCSWAFVSTPLSVLILAICPSPVLALYLFLDSNGDGTRTTADVLSPHDTTHVTVWLVTDQYKEGRSDECSHGRDNEAHSYSLVFQAAGGTITWGRFVPDPSPYEETFSYESDDSTYFKVSRNIPDWGTTHRVRLGTFTATVRRGRPSIEVVDRRPMQQYGETGISTGTWGGPFADCADGLPYGGQANRPPSLTRLADNPIPAGTAERLRMEATDRDGDPLTFRLTQGPSFVSVSTLDPGHGVAQGQIRIEPDSCVQGPAECLIEVSDGFASDADTMLVMVKPVRKTLPTTPMQAPVSSGTPTTPWQRGTVDSQWLAGEWEWHETTSSRIWDPCWPGPHDLPVHRGFRRRLVFSREGTVEMYEIGRDRVLRAQNGTYSIAHEREGLHLTFSKWFDPYYGSFSAWSEGPSSLGMYPWLTRDAEGETFVRVPATQQNGAHTDTARMVAPIDTPRVQIDGGRVRVTQPEPMKAALRKYDPNFRILEEPDARAPGAPNKGRQVRSSAVVGDFDGDLLMDVALLGRSGADQVVVALLSNHGIIGPVEVAWRRVQFGKGENKSRGDPLEVPRIYIELVPRGSFNPFCWTRRWCATPLDAIGIVEPGVGRFDYVLARGQFILFAPVP